MMSNNLDSNLLKNAITHSSELAALIPQKPPIVMVDKLLHFSENKVASGLRVTADNIFTSDYRFTEPGLVENMAQTIALYTGYQFFLKNEPAPVGYIGAIKKVHIHSLPKVGDELVTTAYILHEIMGVTLVEVKVELDGVKVAYAEMKTVISGDGREC